MMGSAESRRRVKVAILCKRTAQNIQSCVQASQVTLTLVEEFEKMDASWMDCRASKWPALVCLPHSPAFGIAVQGQGQGHGRSSL